MKMALFVFLIFKRFYSASILYMFICMFVCLYGSNLASQI